LGLLLAISVRVALKNRDPRCQRLHSFEEQTVEQFFFKVFYLPTDAQ